MLSNKSCATWDNWAVLDASWVLMVRLAIAVLATLTVGVRLPIDSFCVVTAIAWSKAACLASLTIFLVLDVTILKSLIVGAKVFVTSLCEIKVLV